MYTDTLMDKRLSAMHRTVKLRSDAETHELISHA